MARRSQGRFVHGWLAILVIAAAAGAGTWYFYWREEAPRYSFDTVAVDRGLIEQSVSATGAVQALTTVDLSSQLSGQIADVMVDFNTKVKAGDLLAVLDKKTFAAKVKSAEANLAMAKSSVEVQEATIQKNKALVKNAQENLARQQHLAAKGAASQAVLDTASTALATAEADLAVAVAQLANANASVAQRQSDLEQARIDLERTEIRSPIDGVVIARNIDPGATVAASLQAPILFQIARDLSKIQIEAQVDEADIGRIEKGDAVTFTVDSYPDRIFRGQVAQVRIGGTVENNVVTYTVIVDADNPRERLLPGMTATVRIVTGRKENALRLPNAAVRFIPPQGVPGAETAPRWGRNEAFLAELADLLKLTDAQKVKLKAELDAAAARRIDAQSIEQPRSNLPVGKSANRQRQQGSRPARNAGGEHQQQGNLSRILHGLMTEEQAKIFQRWREERHETTRPAVVWLPQGEGMLPRKIRLGLYDEAYSEIVGGVLKAGDRVVTRVRKEPER
jgi:HlyD family secretion protein